MIVTQPTLPSLTPELSSPGPGRGADMEEAAHTRLQPMPTIKQSRLVAARPQKFNSLPKV